MVVTVEELNELSRQALLCRELGHAVLNEPVDKIVSRDNKKAPLEIDRETVCARCGRIKVNTYNVRTWELIKSRVWYPDYYLIKGGVSRQEIQAYRWKWYGKPV